MSETQHRTVTTVEKVGRFWIILCSSETKVGYSNQVKLALVLLTRLSKYETKWIGLIWGFYLKIKILSWEPVCNNKGLWQTSETLDLTQQIQSITPNQNSCLLWNLRCSLSFILIFVAEKKKNGGCRHVGCVIKAHFRTKMRRTLLCLLNVF